MTLHWVMYEKSMGMCAADMCEGVLAHARGYFSAAVHMLSAPSTHQSTTAGGGKSSRNGDTASANLMVIGDSDLTCAAREARALHGMLVTIHEVRLPSVATPEHFLCVFFSACSSLLCYAPRHAVDSETLLLSKLSRCFCHCIKIRTRSLAAAIRLTWSRSTLYLLFVRGSVGAMRQPDCFPAVSFCTES